MNAKARTVATNGAFRTPIQKRRCLVLADGFYEWRTLKRKKLPVHFHLKSGQPLAFAGLWDVWGEGAAKVFTCVIITTTPNELTGTVHDRMPVIVARDAEATWLDPAIHEPGTRTRLLVPYPAGELAASDANPVANKAGSEGPEALMPPAGGLFS